MSAYYNEFDPYPAQWLRNLIAAGHLPPGDVDERDIKDIHPDDLKGYTQCHFFAGIGGWPLALRLAGWPDDRPVWTGSCPCQPFSVGSVNNGQAQGQNDERHVWPHWRPLIGERKPATIFGEQVAGAIGWGWWDDVALWFEGQAYACAAAVLRADAANADHERKRLFWCADAGSAGRERYQSRESVFVGEAASLSVAGDVFAGARRALAGDYGGLLSGDGVSVAVERSAAKGYGNAIVPQVGARFVSAVLEAI